jgi:hypothetical protein
MVKQDMRRLSTSSNGGRQVEALEKSGAGTSMPVHKKESSLASGESLLEELHWKEGRISFISVLGCRMDRISRVAKNRCDHSLVVL